MTVSGRRVAAVVAMLVVTPFVVAGSCRPGVAKACDVLHEGQRVEVGQVVGMLRAVCDPPPQSHLLSAVLEVRVADTWIARGRAAVVSVIPDITGFPVEVRAECREGTYRVRVVVEGTGPAPSLVPPARWRGSVGVVSFGSGPPRTVSPPPTDDRVRTS